MLQLTRQFSIWMLLLLFFNCSSQKPDIAGGEQYRTNSNIACSKFRLNEDFASQKNISFLMACLNWEQEHPDLYQNILTTPEEQWTLLANPVNEFFFSTAKKRDNFFELLSELVTSRWLIDISKSLTLRFNQKDFFGYQTLIKELSKEDYTKDRFNIYQHVKKNPLGITDIFRELAIFSEIISKYQHSSASLNSDSNTIIHFLNSLTKNVLGTNKKQSDWITLSRLLWNEEQKISPLQQSLKENYSYSMLKNGLDSLDNIFIDFPSSISLINNILTNGYNCESHQPWSALNPQQEFLEKMNLLISGTQKDFYYELWDLKQKIMLLSLYCGETEIDNYRINQLLDFLNSTSQFISDEFQFNFIRNFHGQLKDISFQNQDTLLRFLDTDYFKAIFELSLNDDSKLLNGFYDYIVNLEESSLKEWSKFILRIYELDKHNWLKSVFRIWSILPSAEKEAIANNFLRTFNFQSDSNFYQSLVLILEKNPTLISHILEQFEQPNGLMKLHDLFFKFSAEDTIRDLQQVFSENKIFDILNLIGQHFSSAKSVNKKSVKDRLIRNDDNTSSLPMMSTVSRCLSASHQEFKIANSYHQYAMPKGCLEIKSHHFTKVIATVMDTLNRQNGKTFALDTNHSHFLLAPSMMRLYASLSFALDNFLTLKNDTIENFTENFSHFFSKHNNQQGLNSLFYFVQNILKTKIHFNSTYWGDLFSWFHGTNQEKKSAPLVKGEEDLTDLVSYLLRQNSQGTLLKNVLGQINQIELEQLIRFLTTIGHYREEVIIYNQRGGAQKLTLTHAEMMERLITDISFNDGFFLRFFVNKIASAKNYKKVNFLKHILTMVQATSGVMRATQYMERGTRFNMRNVKKTYPVLTYFAKDYKTLNGETINYSQTIHWLIKALHNSSDQEIKQYSAFAKKQYAHKFHGADFLLWLAENKILSRVSSFLNELPSDILSSIYNPHSNFSKNIRVIGNHLTSKSVIKLAEILLTSVDRFVIDENFSINAINAFNFLNQSQLKTETLNYFLMESNLVNAVNRIYDDQPKEFRHHISSLFSWINQSENLIKEVVSLLEDPVFDELVEVDFFTNDSSQDLQLYFSDLISFLRTPSDQSVLFFDITDQLSTVHRDSFISFYRQILFALKN